MTIGRRCQAFGYGFAWDPYSDKPYYTLPDGKGGWDGDMVQMQSFDFVPYLPDYDNDVDERGMPVCPAPVASEVEAPLLAWSRMDLGNKVFRTRKILPPP